jgi:hypothetical protein
MTNYLHKRHIEPLHILINNKGKKYFFIGILGGGVQFGSLGTAATNKPIVPPRVIMMMDKLVKR